MALSGAAAGSPDSTGDDDLPDADEWPELLDRQRAVIASAFTYRDAAWCRRRLPSIRRLNFIKVLFPHPEKGRFVHNLVFAVASDDVELYYNSDGSDISFTASIRTLFVAFPGTTTVRDVLVDLDADLRRGAGSFMGAGVVGQYHRGFLTRLEEILPQHFNSMLSELIHEYGIRRLIFCGHSLGGALAHLALIKFTAATQSLNECLISSPPISITFGSPQFCDAEASNFLNESKLANRMFTWINKGDPVPCVLNHPMAARKALLRLLLDGFSVMATKLLRPAPASTAPVEDTGRPNWWGSGFSVGNFCQRLYALLTVTPRKAPRYVWVGQTNLHPAQIFPQQLRDVDLSPQAFQCHKIRSYVSLVCPILRDYLTASNFAPPQYDHDVVNTINYDCSLMGNIVGGQLIATHQKELAQMIVVERRNLATGDHTRRVSLRLRLRWKLGRRLSWRLVTCKIGGHPQSGERN